MRPVITWAQVLGSYLYYLGGVSYTRNQGFQGEARTQNQSSIAQESNKAVIRYLDATAQVNEKESVQYRQTYGGIPLSHPA